MSILVFGRRSILLWSLVIGPVIFGIALVWVMTSYSAPPPWNQSDKVFLVPPLLGILGAIFWIALFARKIGMRQALWGGHLLAWSIAGFSFMSLPVIQLTNARWDINPPSEVRAVVVGKEIENRRGTRGTTTHYQLALAISSHGSMHRRIYVKQWMWHKVDAGDRVVVRVGQGLFCWPYVESITRESDARANLVETDITRRTAAKVESLPAPIHLQS
ncbi:MAG TPA: hypothetical protein VLJ57_14380 [Burkholderiaceae bacterium]|nr:hypothetical protein [Burkholderiaceae bacterium]